MSLLKLFKHHSKWLRLTITVVIVLLLNLSLAVFSYFSFSKQEDAFLALIPDAYLTSEQSAIWISKSPLSGLQFDISEHPDKAYKTITLADKTIFLEKSLIKYSGWPLFLGVNVFFLLIAAIIFFLLRKKRRPFEIGIEQLDEIIQLLQKQIGIEVPEQLAPDITFDKIIEKIRYLVHQDQEVRHLVRVQSWIDQALAIGNRIFFESKLHHYLSSLSDNRKGGLFIIEITHPETEIAESVHISRLKHCVELVNELISAYSDTVLARLSEHDLALLIPGLTEKETENLGDTIASLICRASCFKSCDHKAVVHIGYANYQQGDTAYNILSEADLALKTAQLHGPCAAYGFSEEQRKPLLKGAVWWQEELKKSLKEQKFYLNFQPVFALDGNEILQYEALVRLKTDDGEIVSASIFLPMAYKCGLSYQIDQFVLLKAAETCELEKTAMRYCSVNISTSTLLNEQWWPWLEANISSGTIKTEYLAIEVAEHWLNKNYKELKDKLLSLHQLGFTLVIDNVGLSIENPLYANELPINAVKLHPAVVQNIQNDSEQQLFLRGVIADYAAKNIEVIACAVETAEEWDTLKRLGVSAGQGFYFSKPLMQITATTAVE